MVDGQRTNTDAAEAAQLLAAEEWNTRAKELHDKWTADEEARFVLPIHSLAEIAADNFQLRWMIQNFWTQGAFGQLAGAEKTLKTYQAILVALAVASGRPLYGQFEVVTSGPVVYFTGEGANDHVIAQGVDHVIPQPVR